MDTQLKKGLIDICVLRCLHNEPSYGYKIIAAVTPHIDISESTLYPILKRLEVARCLTTYNEEHNGRLRKYYKITEIGKKKLKEFKKEYEKLHQAITYILGGNKE